MIGNYTVSAVHLKMTFLYYYRFLYNKMIQEINRYDNNELK